MTTDYSILLARLKAEQKRLAEELEQLQASASSSDERREGSPFGKREEEATEALELEKRLVLERRIKEQIIGVEHALHKYEEGTYGLCDSCGQSIDPERLEAIPEASLCINCKAQQAKNAKGKAPTG
jgi:RNA polymerase-binding transcription factor DksA